MESARLRAVVGYQVTSAITGNKALQKLGTEIKVDVVFTDIVMPGGLNGRSRGRGQHNRLALQD